MKDMKNMSVQEIAKLVEEAHDAIDVIKTFEEMSNVLKGNKIQSINFYSDKYGMSSPISFKVNERTTKSMIICFEEIVAHYKEKFNELGINLDELKSE